MNMVLTPGNLMAALCAGWVAQRPEDADLPVNALLRKLLMNYAMSGGVCMVILMSGDTVLHYGLIEFTGYHG